MRKRYFFMAAVGGLSTPGFIAYRRWHSRWGATDDELAMAMPGDDLIERASFKVTRAIAIQAPPEAVWPWIAQIGFSRAGFYSYDWLDNLGRPSADQILPELQNIEAGTWIPMSGTVTEETAFRVEGVDAPHWVLWKKAASTWAWRLIAVDASTTRLIVRLKCRYRWNRPTIITDFLLMEVADFPMMRKLLLGLRDRAERGHAESEEPRQERRKPPLVES